MSDCPSPNPMPEAAAVAPAADAAVPNSPEEGMKSLNGIMTDMLAEPRNSAPMPPSPTRRRRE